LHVVILADLSFSAALYLIQFEKQKKKEKKNRVVVVVVILVGLLTACSFPSGALRRKPGWLRRPLLHGSAIGGERTGPLVAPEPFAHQGQKIE